MHRIPLVPLDDSEIFDNIAAAKRGARRIRLQRIRPEVIVAYEQYSDLAPILGDIAKASFSEDDAAALIHAYEVSTVPMAMLRSALTQRIIAARCPFCGLSETSTLDHYLPKEQYPEFAIFSKNLIPSCSTCNTRKSTLISDADTEVRLFLHPYFDEIPAICFLEANVGILPDALGLDFRVIRSPGLPLAIFRQLRSHFSLLGLADRYRLMSLDYLRTRWRAFSRFYGAGRDSERVSNELLQEAQDYEQEFGINHWRAVLCRTLSLSQAFCDGGFEVLRRIQ